MGGKPTPERQARADVVRERLRAAVDYSTSEEIARAVGVPPNSLSDFLNRKVDAPYPRTLAKYENWLKRQAEMAYADPWIGKMLREEKAKAANPWDWVSRAYVRLAAGRRARPDYRVVDMWRDGVLETEEEYSGGEPE